MADNYQDYFVSRIAGELAAQPHSVGGNDKFQALQQASQDKIAELTQRKALQEAREKVTAESWNNKLGLDPDSFLGTVVDDTASIYSGISRGVGEAVSVGPAVSSFADESGLTEQEYEAFNRHVQKKATPQDLAVLSRRAAPYSERDTPEAKARIQAEADANPNAPTVLQLFERAQEARAIGRRVVESHDRKHTIHPDKRQALSDQLGANFQDAWDETKEGWSGLKKGEVLDGAGNMIAGVGRLLFNAGEAAVTHPGAAKQYILENVPQLVVGGAFKFGKYALTSMNAGYAADHYQQGIENYQATHNGAMPSAAERQEMALYAASLLVAEQTGELGQLAALGKATKGAGDAVRATFKESLKNAGKAAGKGVAGEAPTEGWQTFAEGEITGKPATAQEIYEGAVIGGISGGGLTGGGRALAEAATLIGQPSEQQEATTNRTQVQAEAVATGDVSALVDPKSKTYAPEQAASALVKHSQHKDTTQEAKQANLDKFDQITADLESQRLSAEQMVSMTTVAGTQAVIDQYKAELAAADPADQARVTALTQAVSLFEEQLADFATKPENPKDVKLAQKKLAEIEAQLEEVTKSRAHLTSLVQAPAVLAAQIDLINAPVDPKQDKDALAAVEARSASAAVGVINLAMASPERLSVEQATQLAENQNNALTAPQRAYLRAFSETRQAENKLMTMKGVSQHIYFGTPDNHRGQKYKGIKQYQVAMGAALAAGNQKKADQELAGLVSFERDHQSKAATVAQAIQGGLGIQVLRRRDTKEWFIPTQGEQITGTRPEIDAALRKNGGLIVNSARLVEDTQTEADALSSAVKELRSAYAIKFSNVNGASNVQNASQQGSGTQAGIKAPAKPAATQGGSSTAPAGARAADAQPAGVVGSGDAKAAGLKSAEKTVNTEEPLGSSVNAEEAQSTQDSTVEGELKTEVNSTVELTESQETKATETPAASVAPGLTVLQQRTAAEELPAGTPLGTVYRTINKAIAFLSQKKTEVTSDADIAKDRPLVSIQNLMQRWNSKEVTPDSLFAEELTEDEDHALATFKRFHNKWADDIRASFVKGSINPKQRDDFLFEDPVQDFINEDGTVDENIVTAVAYAMYSWLVDAANRPALLDKEAVLTMHGQDRDGHVTREGLQLLRTMSAFEVTVTNSLGAQVVSALGLKARPNAPQDYLPKVAAGFGVHALLALERQGLINRGTLSFEQLSQFIPEMWSGTDEQLAAQKAFTEFSYVQIPRGEKYALLGDTKTIRDAAVNSRDVLGRMFGSERTPAEASWAPIPFNQATAKDTGQTIPKKLRRVLEKAQKIPNRVIPDMWNALAVLGDDVFLKAAGWREFDETRIQKTNRDAVQAQNNNLEDQLAGAKNLVQTAIDHSPEGIKQPFFANFEVWRNFRVGITTRNLNLQSSKIHRFLFSRPGWESTIRLDDDTQVEMFLVGMAQALGLKVDQQPNTETVQKLEDRLNDPDDHTAELAQKLSKALVDPAKSELTAGDKQAIGDLAAGAEGMQTLQALVALGKFLDAQEAGAESFTATMLVGVDGKTNGPIFSILALGAADSVKGLFKFVNRGGFYSADEGVSNYNHWYQRPGNQDLYEDLARELLSMLPQGIDGALAGFQTITKELISKGKATPAGRKIVKTPLTSFAFGSSTSKSVENMKTAFLQAVVDRIEAVANSQAKGVTAADLVTSINALLELGDPANGSLLLPVNTALETLMELELSPKQERALNAAFQEILGEQVDEGMKDYFSVFSQRRNSVNSSIQASFSIYSALYTDLRNKELNRQMDAGDMAFITEKGVRVPLHDLTVAQEKTLRDKVKAVLPQAHTTFTTGTDDLDSGMYMAKQGSGLSQSPMYRIKVQLGQPLTDGGKPVLSKQGNAVTHLRTKGMEKTEKSPGVAGLPYFMHSFDSGVMHESTEDTDTLNVHDEAANGADKVIQTAQAINKATWANMLRFSPATESYQLLERAVVNAVKLLESGDVSTEALKQIRESLNAKLPFKMRGKIKPENLPYVLLALAKQEQFTAVSIQLGALAQMTTIDQYTWEGGEYQVTDADRKEAGDLLKQHEQAGKNMSAETQAAANALGAAMRDGVKAKQPAKVDPVVIEQSAPVEETRPDDTPAAANPFGEIGKATKGDKGLIEFFEKNPKATVQQVIAHLYGKLNAQPAGGSRDFNLKLLKMLSRSVNPELTVNLITPETKAENLLGEIGRPVLGWYSSRGTDEAIYLTGTEFTHSNIVVELLLHELTHAATAYQLTTAAGKPFKVELEILLEEVRAYVEKHGLSKFAPALVDVDELVAYGMSSQVFQHRVLTQIAMNPATNNGLSNAMHKFVDILARLLGFKDARAANGLGVLLTNVSALFEQSAHEFRDDGQAASPETPAISEAEKAALVQGLENGLPVEQIQQLETHYGVTRNEPQFWESLRDDITLYVNKGADAVAAAVRDILKAISSGVLAVSLVFNPAGLVPQDIDFNLQKVHATTIERTKQIKAEVPKAAQAKMSVLAQSVYQSMAPTAIASGKGFIIADKPAGMLHVFHPDGSVLVQDAALYGKDAGDTMGKSALEGGGKITPAGSYTLRAEADAEYVGGQRLTLVETLTSTQSGSGSVIAVHGAWFGDAKENRAGRLASATGADNKISYGCVNTSHETFLKAILPNITSLNGGMMFVLPDAVETTAEMFPAQTSTETLTTFTTEGAPVSDPANDQDQSGSTRQARQAVRSSARTRRRQGVGAPVNLAMASVAAVEHYTTLEIYEGLEGGRFSPSPAITPAFSDHLRGLLSGIVDKLHGPFGAFKESMRKTEASGPLSVWFKALETGKAPFASQIIASGFAGTPQQDFVTEQVEAVVRAALNANEVSTKVVYRDLAELYQEMYKKLKPSDFKNQSDYDLVFKLEKSNGDRMDHLARFAALGLANQEFNQLLQVATKRTGPLVGKKSFAERFQGIFESVLEFFHSKWTHTYKGQNADQKLAALVNQLIDIEAKQRHVLKLRATENSIMAPVEQGVKGATEWARDKVLAAASSDYVRNHKNTFVKLAGNMTTVVVADRRVEWFMDGITKLRDKNHTEQHGVAMSLLNELKGAKAWAQALLRMAKRHEGVRKDIISNQGKFVLAGFIDQGKKLSDEAKAAITSVFLRTGAHSLLGHFDMAQLEALVASPADLNAAVATYEGKLDPAFKRGWMAHANALAYFKATGENQIDVLHLNAYLIARMAGTLQAGKMTEQQATQAEESIAVLVALYGLRYAGQREVTIKGRQTTELVLAKETLQAENGRADENGIEYTLKLHKRLEQESLAKLFDGNPALMAHGYTPEILNPHYDVQEVGEAEGKELVLRGYAKGARLPTDPANPDQAPKHIYVLNGGGLAPWVSASMSMTGMQAKGSKVHNGYMNVNTADGLANAQLQATITNRKVGDLHSKGYPATWQDLSKLHRSHLAPVFDGQGNIVNWRHLMAEETKNVLLKRDNRFDKVLGALAGSVYDKDTAQEQNHTVVTALLEQYEQDFEDNKDAYVDVGPKSADPELRQLWALLPEATRQDVRLTWGKEAMTVRKDALDIIFGYRKLSAADMFRRVQREREAREEAGLASNMMSLESVNAAQKVFVAIVEGVLVQSALFRGIPRAKAEEYAKRAAVYVSRSEQVWLELVRETKDIIVVRTGLTLAGNIFSNFSMLYLSGVPWKDIAHSHLVALKGATAYMADTEELEKLRTLLAVDYGRGDEAEIKRRILLLENDLARNPVRELIEAGLMPTIVEDVSTDDDPHSYKTALAEWVSEKTAWAPEGLKGVTRSVYMARDTKLYQGLSRVTQLSDFVARYTLYQHLVNRKVEPMESAEAIQRASDTFVNYDIPMHRSLQYSDDMGLTMFTKYFLRIQKELLRVARENPARVLSTVLLGNFIDLGPIVLEGSGLTRIGNNPFRDGALMFPGTLDELLTVNSAMSLIK